MRRPDRVVIVTGTGTEVGKTWVTCAVIRHLRQAGVTVAARKPAQSYEPADDIAARTDAHLLALASGEDPDRVCPSHRRYPVPLAPPMAAEHLGRPAFSIADLAAECDAAWPERCEIGFVETAGGLRSPLADDGDTIALAHLLRPSRMLIVTDAGLGTIHHVRSCVDAIAGAGLPEPIVILNRYDESAPQDLHRRNLAWLRDRDNLDVEVDAGAIAQRLQPPRTDDGLRPLAERASSSRRPPLPQR